MHVHSAVMVLPRGTLEVRDSGSEPHRCTAVTADFRESKMINADNDPTSRTGLPATKADLAPNVNSQGLCLGLDNN